MTRPPGTVGRGFDRGFDRGEFEARLARAQAAMTADELDALVVTTAPNVRYFTGFNTQFWESPTRPWFVVVPRGGAVIAVIPEIGQSGMAETWIENIRSWPAPRPDDDGISLLQATLLALPRRFGRIGWEMGRESVVRMPIRDFDELRDRVGNLTFADGSPTLWSLRRVKSPAEVARLRHVCQLASTAFVDAVLFQGTITLVALPAIHYRRFGPTAISSSRKANYRCRHDRTRGLALRWSVAPRRSDALTLARSRFRGRRHTKTW